MSTTTNVLLVEDDPWLAELEARILSMAGFTVTHAPHAPSAIAKIDDQQPDVIILDVLLTGSTAFALLHELQSYGDTKQIPIILCTNMGDSLDSQTLKAYGVQRVIDKSTMHPDDLPAAVRSILGKMSS